MAKLNLNSFPYYDDFDLDKNFHKVLFKPGYAVQARELTQLQTILQDQIKRFGDNIFKEGSVISGCPESTNFNVDVIKIKDTNEDGVEITDEVLESFVGQIFVGRNDNVKAIVKKVSSGTEATDYKAVFLQYVTQGDSGTTATFAADEILELDTDEEVTIIVADNSVTPITKGSLFSVGDGIVYANGHFIRNYNQTIVLEKYDSTPNKKVGFLVTEEIISSDDDETLLDPAQGAFNATAPGADRFKLTTTIVAYPINEPVEEFFILYEVNDGAISRRYDRTQYAELNKTLARRTYDESGDYVVRPFSYHIREHLKANDNGGVYTTGDAGKIALGVEPGKAYVRGFEYELFATKYLDVVKPTATDEREGLRISTGIGNYLLIEEVCGVFPTDGSLVSLRDGVANAVTSNTYSAATAPGSQIGTARVATVEYDSGTPGTAAATYRIYVYDVNMTNGSLSSVQGIYYDNGSVDFHANIKGAAELYDTKYAPYIIPTTHNYVKSLVPNGIVNSFVYRKKITGVAITGAGAGSISVAGVESFAFTSGSNNTVLSEFFVIAENDISGTPFKAGQFIDMTAGTVSPSSGIINFNIFPAGGITGTPTVSVLVSVARANTSHRTKTLNTDRYVRIQTTKKLGYVSAGTYLTASATSSTIIQFSYNAAVDITSSDCPVGSLIYRDDNTLVGTIASVTPKVDGTSTGPKVVLTSPVSVSTTSSTPLKVVHPDWDVVGKKFTTPPTLGLVDIFSVDFVRAGSAETSWSVVAASGTTLTGQLKIKNGQQDSYYGLGSITGNFLEEYRYVIRVDHFEHGSGEFFTVDSYPLPTQGAAPTSTQIDWHQIPSYTSPSNGSIYDLRNCVDFRASVAPYSGTIGAASTQTLNLSTINPIGYTQANRNFAGTASYFPHPQEEFIADIEWNLPRVDRIILDSEGNFTTVTGKESRNPTEPRLPINCMNLGTLSLPPYPALSPKVAKESGRVQYSVVFSKAELQRRFTMADIGGIENRLTKLEDFTRLSFLEQKTINTLIYNDAGEERFKNGVLVDTFDGINRVNQLNTTNNCLISAGVLTPQLIVDNIDLEVASKNSIYTAPQDVKVVVRSSVSSGNFLVGETVTQATSGATGVVEHAVEIARGGNYKWTRLYLTAPVSGFAGTFTSNVNYSITGGTTGTIGVVTYTGMTTAILATNFRPDLISYPNEGELATLPYRHVQYTLNPYASAAINVANNVVYGYEGDIGLIPAEDVWFEHRTLPDIIVNNFTEVVVKEKEVVRTVERIVTVQVEVPVPVGCGVPAGPEPIVIAPPVVSVAPPPPPEPAPLPTVIITTPPSKAPGDEIIILPVDSSVPPIEVPRTSGGGGNSYWGGLTSKYGEPQISEWDQVAYDNDTIEYQNMS